MFNTRLKVIYQKQNGEIIERIRTTLPNCGIGQETSMGWVIINILFEYKQAFYDFSEYRNLVRQK